MDRLIDILKDINEDIDYETCDTLVKDGHLTSFDIVFLVTEISEEFDISIPPNEIVPENFNSAQKIYELICRLEEE